MSDVIRYRNGEMSAHLDDIAQGIQGAHQVREASDRAFGLLESSGAFLGEAADRLQAVRLQHSQKHDELISQGHAFYQGAVQQQINANALDRQLAGGF